MKARSFVKLIILALFLVGFSSQISNAEPLQVQVLDSDYRIWGETSIPHFTSEGSFSCWEVDSYDETASIPLYIESYHSFDYYRSFWSDDGWSQAISATDEFMVDVHTRSGADYGRANAWAEAYWIFTPMNDIHNINFYYYMDGWGGVEVKLVNLSTSQEIVNGRQGDPDNVTFDNEDDFINRWVDWTWVDVGVQSLSADLTAGSLYSLYLWAHSNSDCDSNSAGINWLDVESVPAPVPEPATMLLLGLGLIGLAGLRRKLKLN